MYDVSTFEDGKIFFHLSIKIIIDLFPIHVLICLKMVWIKNFIIIFKKRNYLIDIGKNAIFFFVSKIFW